MKVVVVRFPDTTDISALTIGSAISVKIGTTEIVGGAVNSVASIENPTIATLIPHNHTVAIPAPSGTTGPAIIT